MRARRYCIALYESWLQAEPKLCGAISKAISSSASKSGCSGKVSDEEDDDSEVGTDAKEDDRDRCEVEGVLRLLFDKADFVTQAFVLLVEPKRMPLLGRGGAFILDEVWAVLRWL